MSGLSLELINSGGANPIRLRFTAMAGKSYSVQCRNDLGQSSWTSLAEVASATTNRVAETLDYSPVGGPVARFYRVVTPGESE